jgi:Zn-dependent protease with chaperone function
MRRKRAGRIAPGPAVFVVTLALALAPLVWAQRTQLKPGWNLFSPQQDAELGRQLSQDAEKQLPMLNNARVDDYLNRLGQRLAANAPGEKFSYRFRAVNDRSINAFALPGGYLYIHRGVIEAAENEAQLAGVMGHEIAHASLRHGTNQASRASAAQLGLGILGGVLGSGSTGAVLTQVGANIFAGTFLLTYSRNAERQADLGGTQMLYDAGYDPRAMAQFFEKLHAQGQRSRMPEWFSSHPRPENRMELAMEEVQRLGGPPPNYRTDSAEFQEIKRLVASMPEPPKSGGGASSGAAGGSAPASAPAAPASRLRQLDHPWLTIGYPENWRVYAQGAAATVAPEGGIVRGASGNTEVAWGAMLNVFSPQADSRGRITVEAATQQLINSMRQRNSGLRVRQSARRVTVGGQRGLSTVLDNPSALGGREIIWMVTALRGNDLVWFLGVAPEKDFRGYERTFQAMVGSIRFRR